MKPSVWIGYFFSEISKQELPNIWRKTTQAITILGQCICPIFPTTIITKFKP
jgi:hypothetical protein